MSTATSFNAPNLQLPWSSTRAEDDKFKRILGGALALVCVLGLVVSLVEVPEIPREEKDALPPELARIILEKKELPKSEPKPKPKPKPKIEKKKPKKVEPKKEPPKKIVPVVTKVSAIDKARNDAAVSGLLQFQDDLQDMRETLDASKVASANITRGQAQAKQLDRSIISSQAKAASGGINVAKLSRDTGGVALSGRETTRVDSKLKDASAIGTQALEKDTREISARSEQDIRKVMDQNKGAIFAIYNRALRRNPALEGKVKVSLVIEPNGSVSSVALVLSELDDEALVRKLLARIRLIRFPSSTVLQTTLNYSFDFLPY